MTKTQEENTQVPAAFEALGLPDYVLKALVSVGYESPSPIQEKSIPVLLKGSDLLGQAQTGTGKTAAFALPIISRIDTSRRIPQAVVLTPTRELAIQVAEAFQIYARYLENFQVLAVYGGQSYQQQIRSLKRGVQVVVGTPGRMMDLMGRKILDLSELDFLVLDEADEMLRMGFIDDVETILGETPSTRQTALFSATMPKPIKRITSRYLKDPEEITIKAKTESAKNIRQRLWIVDGLHKLDALSRIIETETCTGMIVFVRTKQATEEVAEKLQQRGFSAAAVNGDMVQKVRERTIEALKAGRVDILIATDVAARGLDVDRISHVINYDIPYDSEAYIHRIGRTGRAGRKGEAILFAARRERKMLRIIENATKQRFEPFHLPTLKEVQKVRLAAFKEKLKETVESIEDSTALIDIVTDIQQDTGLSLEQISCALYAMVQGKQANPGQREVEEEKEKPRRRDFMADRDGDARPERKRKNAGKKREARDSDIPMESFRIELGYNDGVAPKHIVGAIANEAGIESQYIGAIDIHDNHSLVDLPLGMPKDIFSHLKKTYVLNKPMQISRLAAASEKVEKSKAKKRARGKRAN